MPPGPNTPARTLDYAPTATGAPAVRYREGGAIEVLLPEVPAWLLCAAMVSGLFMACAFAIVPWSVVWLLSSLATPSVGSVPMRFYVVAATFSVASVVPLLAAVNFYDLIRHRGVLSVLQIDGDGVQLTWRWLFRSRQKSWRTNQIRYIGVRQPRAVLFGPPVVILVIGVGLLWPRRFRLTMSDGDSIERLIAAVAALGYRSE